MGRFGSFQKKTQSALGVLTLVCGFCMMWASARGSLQEINSIEHAVRGAIEIDPLLPDVSHNQALVVAAGKFQAPALLEDDYLRPGPYLILRRRVEMYQWIEDDDPAIARPTYRLGWYEGQVDFFRFRETAGHENPLLRAQPMIAYAPVSNFGAFDGSRILRAIQKLVPLELTQELLKDSSLHLEDNKILVPRNPAAGVTSLGDMRVWYEVLPQGEYTIHTRQVDERTLIGANSDQAVFIRQGRFSPEELQRSSSEEVRSVSRGMLNLGAVLFFFGLFSVLLPMAPRMDLRPKVNLQGVPALLVVCAGVTVTALAIFFILSVLG